MRGGVFKSQCARTLQQRRQLFSRCLNDGRNGRSDVRFDTKLPGVDLAIPERNLTPRMTFTVFLYETRLLHNSPTICVSCI